MSSVNKLKINIIENNLTPKEMNSLCGGLYEGEPTFCGIYSSYSWNIPKYEEYRWMTFPPKGGGGGEIYPDDAY